MCQSCDSANNGVARFVWTCRSQELFFNPDIYSDRLFFQSVLLRGQTELQTNSGNAVMSACVKNSLLLKPPQSLECHVRCMLSNIMMKEQLSEMWCFFCFVLSRAALANRNRFPLFLFSFQTKESIYYQKVNNTSGAWTSSLSWGASDSPFPNHSVDVWDLYRDPIYHHQSLFVPKIFNS